MRAKFHPQAWVNDYSVDVDPEGETEWEVTASYLEKLVKHYREAMGDAAAASVFDEDTYESDELRFDPAAPEWVKNWDGPFYVEIIE